MTFTALVQDYAYKIGGYLKLTGNVGVLFTDDSVGANVKLVVQSIDLDGQNFATTPSAPSRVYLVGSDFQTTVSQTVNTFPSEDPGGLFVVLDATGAMPFISEILQSRKIGIAFNQRDGKTDLTTEIDFSVLDVEDNGDRRRGNDTVDLFSKCMLAVTAAAKP